MFVLDAERLSRRCRHSRVRILGLDMRADVIVGNELSCCAASLAARRSACASPQVRARFAPSSPRSNLPCFRSHLLRGSVSGEMLVGPTKVFVHRRDLHGPRHSTAPRPSRSSSASSRSSTWASILKHALWSWGRAPRWAIFLLFCTFWCIFSKGCTFSFIEEE
jgi:hypothetical protein